MNEICCLPVSETLSVPGCHLKSFALNREYNSLRCPNHRYKQESTEQIRNAQVVILPSRNILVPARRRGSNELLEGE